ncbi:MAG: hypothetical protein AB1453_04915 [Chloroflexota bacterium]|jgi:hypothetical protein
MKTIIPTIGTRGDVQLNVALALVQMKTAEMRAKAAALGEKIRAEDGVSEAVRLIGRAMNC